MEAIRQNYGSDDSSNCSDDKIEQDDLNVLAEKRQTRSSSGKPRQVSYVEIGSSSSSLSSSSELQHDEGEEESNWATDDDDDDDNSSSSSSSDKNEIVKAASSSRKRRKSRQRNDATAAATAAKRHKPSKKTAKKQPNIRPSSQRTKRAAIVEGENGAKTAQPKAGGKKTPKSNKPKSKVSPSVPVKRKSGRSRAGPGDDSLAVKEEPRSVEPSSDEAVSSSSEQQQQPARRTRAKKVKKSQKAAAKSPRSAVTVKAEPQTVPQTSDDQPGPLSAAIKLEPKSEAVDCAWRPRNRTTLRPVPGMAMNERHLRHSRKKFPPIKATPFKETFRCRECGKLFGRFRSMTSHIESQHRGPFPCPHCKKLFSRKDNLKVHVTSLHLKQSFKCEKCGVAFSHSTSLSNHQRKKGCRDRTIICNICWRRFDTPGGLLVHKQKAHKVKKEEPILSSGSSSSSSSSVEDSSSSNSNSSSSSDEMDG